jgi:alpha-mannosidase
VILTALKKVQDNAALVFRFFEFEGKTSTVRLHFPEAATQAAQVNLMEKLPSHFRTAASKPP